MALKIQPATQKRMIAEMRTVASNGFVNVEQAREVLNATDAKMRNALLWAIWNRVCRDRRDDDTHPRFTTHKLDDGTTWEAQRRYLSQAPNGEFEMYPDGANDDNMTSFFRTIKASDLLPEPCVGCTVAGCECGLIPADKWEPESGMIDSRESESFELATVRHNAAVLRDPAIFAGGYSVAIENSIFPVTAPSPDAQPAPVVTRKEYPLYADGLRVHLETLTDLYGNLYSGFGDGSIDRDEFPDSRSHLDTMLQWAKDFDALHADTDWDQRDYIIEIDDYFTSKLAQWRKERSN